MAQLREKLELGLLTLLVLNSILDQPSHRVWGRDYCYAYLRNS